MQKCLLYVGAFKSQLPPIKCAKVEGHYAITCDYLPDNSRNKLTRIEEVVHYKRWITSEQLKVLAEPLKKTEYGQFMLEMAGIQ